MITMKELHHKQKHIIDIFGKEPSDLDELAQACIKVVNNTTLYTRFKDKPFVPKLVGFAWNISYNPTVSNSHDAPLNGVTNWGGSYPDRPRNYPGFSGRVWFRLAKECDTWGSDILASTLTHPGTGGGGAYGGPWSSAASAFFKKFGNKNTKKFKDPHLFSYDYRFFLDDHPWLEKYINWEILKGKNIKDIKHTFQWTDEETLEHDKELIDFVERTIKE